MSAKAAAPAAGTRGRGKSNAECAKHVTEGALAQATALPPTLPAALRDRLAAADIESCETWRALGHRRFSIFGVTSSMVVAIDAAVMAALKAAV
jgi:hypothetical protein